MELVTLSNASTDIRLEILHELDHDIVDGYVVDADGQRVIDPYVDRPVRADNMLILPGSLVILDDNPLSIAEYIEEHGDRF